MLISWAYYVERCMRAACEFLDVTLISNYEKYFFYVGCLTSDFRCNPPAEAGRQGPDWRKCTAYRQAGHGGLPLGPRLGAGLGLTVLS